MSDYCSIHGYYPSRTAVGCPQCELQQPTRAQMIAMRPAATPPPNIQERDRKARAWDALARDHCRCGGRLWICGGELANVLDPAALLEAVEKMGEERWVSP